MLPSRLLKYAYRRPLVRIVGSEGDREQTLLARPRRRRCAGRGTAAPGGAPSRSGRGRSAGRASAGSNRPGGANTSATARAPSRPRQCEVRRRRHRAARHRRPRDPQQTDHSELRLTGQRRREPVSGDSADRDGERLALRMVEKSRPSVRDREVVDDVPAVDHAERHLAGLHDVRREVDLEVREGDGDRAAGGACRAGAARGVRPRPPA